MSNLLENDSGSKVFGYISKQVTLLKSSDRSKRITALMNIRNELSECKNFLPQTAYEQLFISFYKNFLMCFSDTAEKCREIASDILNTLINKLQFIDETAASTIVGSLLLRLSSVDEWESSEEVRIIQIDVLSCLIKLAGVKLLQHVNDIVCILQKCIVDPSPEVKCKSCVCASDIAHCFPKNFQGASNHLINPLLQTVSHQHWKIRAACVIAIGSVIQYGNNKRIPDVICHLAQRLFDRAPPVRLSVVHVVSMWLMELPERYSYFPCLLPLMLSSLSDEFDEVKCEALKFWQKVGDAYLKENEKTFKDQIDFPMPIPNGYPDNPRPNLGCRLLVQQHFVKILPALLNDLDNWIVETRVKASELLYVLLLHCEEKSTMKLHLFIQGILTAGKDEEKRASEMAMKTAELLGCFTDTKLWCDNMLSLILEKPSTCCLSVLAALIRGSVKKKFQECFMNISKALAEPDVCRNRQSDIQANILLCVEALLLSSNKVDSEISFYLFSVLTSVAGIATIDAIIMKVDDLLQLLTSVQSMSSVNDLYKVHASQFLKEISDDHEAWDSRSSEVPIFIYVVENGCMIADVINSAISVIIGNLGIDKDPKLRSQMLYFVSSLIKKNHLFSNQVLSPQCIFILIQYGIFPNLIWSAGKTAAALRTVAAANLWEVISNKRLEISMLSTVGEEFLTILNSMADDNVATNRLLACKILTHVLPALSVHEHSVHKTCQEFLRCLDDETDDIRIASIAVFEAYFQTFPESYDWSPYKSYLQHIYQNILIHMDDENEIFRMKVFDLLKGISFALPEILLEQIEEVRDVMSAVELCDDLTNHIKELKIGKGKD